MTQKTPFALVLEGFRASLPLMVGVAPFGIVFGTLAINAGLSPLQAIGMSVFVIAGASQFVGTQLIGDGAPALVIILTTFVINLRHFLYSASLAPLWRPFSIPWRMLLGYLMVDEVYAPSMNYYQQGGITGGELRWFFLGAGFNLAVVWWGTTLIGVAVGDVVSEEVAEALGFTLPLIFTAIVVPQLTNQPKIRAALVAAIMGIVLAPLPYKAGLLIAALMGIAVGVLSEKEKTA